MEKIQKKLDMIEREREKGRIRKEIEKVKIERQNNSLVELVNIEWRNNSPKENDRLKKEIDKKPKSIERSMTDTQNNNSLTKLTKKIETLNAPLERRNIERDITVLDITDSLDNEKTDRHDRNTICHKCKGYKHTKKQCDKHNKIVKQINKLDFEKDIINDLMKIFNVKQNEIDQIKKELKSTNPHKINKRKGKQKEIIIKLINNLPNHLKEKQEYLLHLKDSIDIPIICIKYKKYGHHVTECGKKEKVKKEKTKMKQDKTNIKPITKQDLMTEVKIIKQEIKEIKEDNSTDINEQNITKIINLKDFPKTLTDFPITDRSMTDPPDPPTDKDVTNINSRQNFLFLIDRVIFQKWHTKITLVINKEFSLTEIALKEILFRFISPPIPKEIDSLNNISIIKEIDKERIYRKKKKKTDICYP